MSTRAVTPRSRKDRDAGLARIKQLTNWSLAGALAGTGLFAGLAATHTASTAATATKTTPATTATPATATTGESDDSATTANSSATTATTPTTATPAPAVAASNAPIVVTSGAS